ncbi:MAG: hydrogenase formation protein HypD, partial [Magnetococcales bacterium]|nr:hydrogenase formation protein HypD [Magnetococcales bacterium]
GHERTVTMSGLRSLLPEGIEIIPGPGCPVCVCPEEDIRAAIQLALEAGVTLLAFGDMLRVPVHVARGEAGSLVEARAMGGEILPIASPKDAVAWALDNPDRQGVFFAAGFETTMAPVAAMLHQGMPANLSLLLSGRRTWPAVAALLQSDSPGFDALIAPGHVASVMGGDEWSFVVEQHGIPTAVAGFTAESLLTAIYSTVRQIIEERIFLDNCYPQVVRPQGNASARRIIDQVFTIVDAPWRGIGVLPQSGYDISEPFAPFDAAVCHPEVVAAARERRGEMPPGCDCAAVLLGKLIPSRCRLYGDACTPRHPVGPCMVSDEGACRIWWSGGYGKRS